MAFYAGRMVRKPAIGNPTVVALADRNDLDEQLFAACAPCADLLRQPRCRLRAEPSLGPISKRAKKCLRCVLAQGAWAALELASEHADILGAWLRRLRHARLDRSPVPGPATSSRRACGRPASGLGPGPPQASLAARTGPRGAGLRSRMAGPHAPGQIHCAAEAVWQAVVGTALLGDPDRRLGGTAVSMGCQTDVPRADSMPRAEREPVGADRGSRRQLASILVPVPCCQVLLRPGAAGRCSVRHNMDIDVYLDLPEMRPSCGCGRGHLSALR